MGDNKLIQIITYYKQTLADVLEENFMFKATIQELNKEIEELKKKEEEKE